MRIMDNCPVCNSPLPQGAAVCPSCGFKITGTTQEFQPIAFGEAPAQAPAEAEPAPSASLTVVRGPQNLDTTYVLENREMSVGRSPHCDIFLNDMTVSRDHAVIFPVGDEFAIKDDGSFNGIWINNESISQSVMHDGDYIQIGAFVLKFQE